MYKKTAAFTIVELLIVIVVIAILAAITITVFNGVQTRARNNTVISTMNDYVKAIKLYQADKGSLPESGAATNLYRCLGEGYIDNRCGGVGVGAACGFGAVSGNTAFNNALRPYFSGVTLPLVTPQEVLCVDGPVRGAVYAFRSSGQYADIYFWLTGSTTCSKVAGVQTYSTVSGEVTRCSLTLHDS